MSMDKIDKNGYVFDPENTAEMTRLINLHRFMTKAMGGPFVGVPDSSLLQTVLDLGCGPGGWVLDVAFACPNAEVVGVDISQSMIAYAQARARSQQLANAFFEVMDITKPLDFSDASFDLINARFLFAVLQRDEWPTFIAECTRILRPGGILRLTEMLDTGVTTSQAFEKVNVMANQVLWKTGHGFSPDGHAIGITPVLPRLLRQAGYQDVQHATHALEVSMGTEAWSDFYRNTEIVGQFGQSIIASFGLATPEELQGLYQQVLIELQMDDFSGLWHYMTVWGRNGSKQI